MIEIGATVNAGAIVAGGLLGLTVGSLISRRVQATLVSGMAVGTMFIGAGATFSKMLIASPGVKFNYISIYLFIHVLSPFPRPRRRGPARDPAPM